MSGPVTIYREFHFDAAHHLPHVPEGHKCRNPHGHTYALTVRLTGDPDPITGWLVDFADLDRIVKALLASIDHRTLNDVRGLENPTVETLAVWVWDRLRPAVVLGGLEVEIREGARNGAIYRGPRDPDRRAV